MKNLLTDVWHDLRAKRLWPVALVLLAGLVAVPVLLAKSPAEPAAPPPPAAEAEPNSPDGPAQLAEVKLEELGQGTGSSLSSFDDPSNPFAPPEKVMEKIREETEGVDTVDNALPGGGGGGGDEVVDGGSLGGGSGADGGSGGTGGTPDSGGTPEVPQTPGDTGGDKPTTTNFTYVADVTFRANNKRRKIKALEKLDILPDRADPLLIFLGVTPNAGNAVFLVDSTLQAAGEGQCKPSRSECAFLYLGPGSEHEFTNDEGDSYTLRVDEIRRVEIGRDGKDAGASKKDSRKQVAGAALQQPTPARRFSVPLLADVVSVSSGEGIDSNSNPDRR
jgi:hypothetical protein